MSESAGESGGPVSSGCGGGGFGRVVMGGGLVRDLSRCRLRCRCTDGIRKRLGCFGLGHSGSVEGVRGVRVGDRKRSV